MRYRGSGLRFVRGEVNDLLHCLVLRLHISFIPVISLIY